MADLIGTIVATCMSPDGGIPKYPQEEMLILSEGVDGDFHAKLGTKDRAVSVVGEETYDYLKKNMKIELKPGDFSENILTRGLGDLSDLEAGDKIRFGNEVLIEVTEQNAPCSALAVYHEDILRPLVGARGVVCRVLTTGKVRPGQTATVNR